MGSLFSRAFMRNEEETETNTSLVTSQLVIPDKAERVVWSLTSVSNDQYLAIGNKGPDSGEKYLLNAAGTAEGTDLPSVKVTFKFANKPGPKGVQWYYMTFQKNDETYRMSKTEDRVVAVKESDESEQSAWWLPVRMLFPNTGYFVFESFGKNSKGQDLYLSSNGKGELKLKPVKDNDFPPPVQNYQMDVTMLFRVANPEMR